MIKVGVDIMGGDFAPKSIVEGSVLSLSELPADVQLVLIGDEQSVESLLNDKNLIRNKVQIVHSSEVIEMGENPTSGFARKRKSSIAIGYQLLENGEIDGFASAGNTGAMLVGAMSTLKLVPGLLRPSISATIPREKSIGVLLDIGLNADAKPEVLYQYAILGSKYATNVLGIENPKIGLLNIGTEPEKGNLNSKAAFELMKNTTEFNFVGNVEGTHLFDNTADVIVTDGFTGNIVLKSVEAFYTLVRKRKVTDDFFNRFDFEETGGTPILGINAPVVIGHGASNAIAIKNMITHTHHVIVSGLTEKIKQAFH